MAWMWGGLPACAAVGYRRRPVKSVSRPIDNPLQLTELLHEGALALDAPGTNRGTGRHVMICLVRVGRLRVRGKG
jgi:hypothetical protein